MDYETHVVTQIRSVIRPLIPIVVGPTSSMCVVLCCVGYGCQENVNLLPRVYSLDVSSLLVYS